MKYFIISSFINASCCGICCILVLISNFKSKIAKSFAIFVSVVALWSFFYFLSMLATQDSEALIYSRILNTIAIFIPPSFLNFCIKVTENKKQILKNIQRAFLTIDFLLLFPFLTGTLFIQSMAPKLLFSFWPVPGPLFHYSTFQFSILSVISFYLIALKIRCSRNEERRQLIILFLSLLIGFLGGGTNYFPLLNIPIVPYGNAFVSIFTFGFIYLVFKYQIMDIKVILSRSFVYTILIFLITLLYFLFTYFTETYLKELIGYKSFLFSLLSATIIALAFIPLKEFIQNIIDKIFFGRSIQDVDKENILLKQEIIRSERMKSIATLASGMAHEIKNPLTPLKTFAEALPQKLDDKEFLLKFSKIINNEVNRIDTLVQELLEYAKPATLRLKPVNLHQLLDHTLDFLNNDLIKYKISLVRDYRFPQGKTINIDDKQFRQALLNLFLNAIDAMPQGGTLTVETNVIPVAPTVIPERFCRESNPVTITISDTGTGIDTKDLPHIFDPFFSKKDRGTGLGLSITHEIIKNHNGKILVESNPGKGTKFTITLPYEKAQ